MDACLQCAYVNTTHKRLRQAARLSATSAYAATGTCIYDCSSRNAIFAFAGVSALLAIDAGTVLQARRGFQSQLSATFSAGALFTATSAATVSAAALFEELLPSLAAANSPVREAIGQSSGVQAAMALYQHAVDAVPVQVMSFWSLPQLVASTTSLQ